MRKEDLCIEDAPQVVHLLLHRPLDALLHGGGRSEERGG